MITALLILILIAIISPDAALALLIFGVQLAALGAVVWFLIFFYQASIA